MMQTAPADEVRQLLERHWDAARGYCVPNPETYPHLWLWDSCFHSIIWAHLQDRRAVVELGEVLAGSTSGGMVPHMRYGAEGPDTWLGPLTTTSSLTQPPMYGHAAKVLDDHGIRVPATTLSAARAGLEWLWENRRTGEGLMYVVHPWEAGNDHSPRWDGWGAPGQTAHGYDREARTAWNKELMHDISFSPGGEARWSSSFVSCPAGFNAYVAFNMLELAAVLGDDTLRARARTLSEAMDGCLWDEDEQLWFDRAIVGGGDSVEIPTSDGLLGALVTSDVVKANAALDQLNNPDRFAAPFGPSNVARTHPTYDPGSYWRGPAWPPLTYLLWLALLRTNRRQEAEELTCRTSQTVTTNGWAEYWNPETGHGLGAAPQSWTGLVLAMQPGNGE